MPDSRSLSKTRIGCARGGGSLGVGPHKVVREGVQECLVAPPSIVQVEDLDEMTGLGPRKPPSLAVPDFGGLEQGFGQPGLDLAQAAAHGAHRHTQDGGDLPLWCVVPIISYGKLRYGGTIFEVTSELARIMYLECPAPAIAFENFASDALGVR